MRITFNLSNLRKHNVSCEEVLEVFNSEMSLTEDLVPSRRGNDRRLIIGWTCLGRVLEVGVEYFEYEDREHIFHAQDARTELHLELVARFKNGR